MSNRRSAADRLNEACKLTSTAAHAAGLLRAASELAAEDDNQCSAWAYLAEAYVRRLHRVIETHMEHLREHDFSVAAQWRTAAMATADEVLDDAQSALRIAAA